MEGQTVLCGGCGHSLVVSAAPHLRAKASNVPPPLPPKSSRPSAPIRPAVEYPNRKLSLSSNAALIGTISVVSVLAFILLVVLGVKPSKKQQNAGLAEGRSNQRQQGEMRQQLAQQQRAAVRTAMYAFDVSGATLVRSLNSGRTSQDKLQTITRHLQDLFAIDRSQTPADFKTAFDQYVGSVERLQRVLAKEVSMDPTVNPTHAIQRIVDSLARSSRGDNSGGLELINDVLEIQKQKMDRFREVSNAELKMKAIAKRYGYTGQ